MKIKVSTIIGILTVLQYLYTIALIQGWYVSAKHFSLEHEDLIFILHLMTWFIVASIEKVTFINEVNIWNQKK